MTKGDEVRSGSELELDPFESEIRAAFEQFGGEQAGDAALLERISEAASTASVGGGLGLAAKIGLGLGIAGVVVAAAVAWPRGDGEREPGENATVVAAPEVDDQTEVDGAEVEPEPSAEVEVPQAVAPAAEPEAEPAESSKRRSSASRAEPSEPDLSAAQLLARANERRRAGALDEAVATFRELARKYPGSREDLVGRVSLGKLYLRELKQPRHAIEAFEAYLDRAPRGALAEEALRDEAAAYRALGDANAERQAWRVLLERFPDTAHAGQAAERIRSLTNGSGG